MQAFSLSRCCLLFAVCVAATGTWAFGQEHFFDVGDWTDGSPPPPVLERFSTQFCTPTSPA